MDDYERLLFDTKKDKNQLEEELHDVYVEQKELKDNFNELAGNNTKLRGDEKDALYQFNM